MIDELVERIVGAEVIRKEEEYGLKGVVLKIEYDETKVLCKLIEGSTTLTMTVRNFDKTISQLQITLPKNKIKLKRPNYTVFELFRELCECL